MSATKCGVVIGGRTVRQSPPLASNVSPAGRWGILLCGVLVLGNAVLAVAAVWGR